MTAAYPLSVQRRFEQKWAERVKSVAARPAKDVGQIEATRSPVNMPGPTPFSVATGPQPNDQAIA